MKAAVYYGKEDIRVENVSDLSLQDGDLLMQVEACSVCGTDLRTYRNGDKKIAPPRILGHEFCGTIVESRSKESNVKVGDRAVMYIVLSCGECKYCRAGRENLCTNRSTMSYHYDGGFAPFVKIPSRFVTRGSMFKVENTRSSQEMSLAEPLGCVTNAHDHLHIGLKDKVAIIGSGPIGAMHAVLARLQGAESVHMIDINQSRLDMMKRFDIDGTILSDKEGSHIQKSLDITDGFGFDVVIVAVSNAFAQADALEIAGKGARVEFFGGLPKSNPTATLNTNHLHYKELIVSGSYSEKITDFKAAYKLIESGRFPAEKFITHVLPLDRINESFELMEKGEALKVCIDPRI
ncbi:MAG: alcohol dehydrogenase catalytic domain-containing protein [Bacteroidota bacterium]|nr:alcohol dehydrogenase catalytic domain-containing protein [Bacteroidota bacterium]